MMSVQHRIQAIDESLVRLSSSSSSSSSLPLGGSSLLQRLQIPHPVAPSSTSTTSVCYNSSTCFDFAKTNTTSTTSDPVTGAAATSSNATIAKQSFYDEIAKIYSPITLEKQFQDLYRLFRPALITTPTDSSCSNKDSTGRSNKDNHSETLTNASAFIQGSRGSGKSLLVQKVLQAIMDEIHQLSKSSNSLSRIPSFRYVYINGLLVPGHSVHTVVQEILHQLIQQHSYIKKTSDSSNASSAMNIHHQFQPKRKRRHQSDENHLDRDETNMEATVKPPPSATADVMLQQLISLSLNKSTFTNQLQLLNEIIEVASVDHIPILFVLDELDTFVSSNSSSSHNTTANTTSISKRDKDKATTITTGTHSNSAVFHQERQLLLYHLLERVTRAGSCCNFIGISSDSTVMMKLEKRIKSRAEGVSKFIMTPSGNHTFGSYIVPVLCHAIANEHAINFDPGCSKTNSEDLQNSMNCDETLTIVSTGTSLQEEVSNVFKLNNSTSKELQPRQTQSARIYETLQRSYNLGKDVRWFRNIIYIALSLYRYDVILWKEKNQSIMSPSSASSFPIFHCKYIEEAIVDMGGSLVVGWDTNTSTSAGPQQPILPESADLRVQTLYDLSGPLLVLVLSARRILYRDSCVQHRSSNSSNKNDSNETSLTSATEYNPQQLTLRRIINEYQTSYKGLTSKYSIRILQKSFIELLEIGIFRPSIDHSGTIPFQYQYRDAFLYQHHNFDVIERLPLHMTLDIHYDIKHAIDNNLLMNCSTALREWGRKIN